MRLSQQFTEVVKGKNFMTPHFEGYIKHGDYVCEISTGSGIIGEKLFGVTVANVKTKTHERDLSRVFESHRAAIDYISKLSKEG